MSGRLEAVPRELTQRDQWLVWRYEKRGGKLTKVPYSATTAERASSTDPDTWASFEEALTTSEGGHWNGIGFVFTPDDPFAGVDLDDCRNAATGEVEPWARDIVDALSSYTEVSPSDTGLKVFIKGKLPSGRRRRGDLEMYDSERYFTVTGKHLEGTTATIEERSEELAALHARVFDKPEPRNARRGGTDGPRSANLDDAAVIEKAQSAKNGAKFAALWRGDTSGYPSPSEADSALCSILAFWMGGDSQRVDRLFRQSGLHREKWDERRGDGTYGTRTIAAVLDNMTETYEPCRASDDGASRDPPSEDESDVIRETELGNALRLVRRHGQDIRYCYPQGRWYAWDGVRWRRDETGEVHRCAKETVRSIFHEAAEAEGDKSKKLANHALRSEAEAKISAMVALARSESGIPVMPQQLDADPWLLNVQNGTIDLRAGKIHPHRRDDLITKLTPVKYDPDAEAPVFMGFLDRIMDGNQGLITYLQRTLGRTLTADVSEHRLELWHGVGANGKSTLMNAILDVMGDYGRVAAPGLLLRRHQDRHPTEVADLKGARFVGSVEVGEGRKLAEELVKQLTGGDRLKARYMREDFWEFSPTHKLFIACNHKPRIRGSDHAIWRRVKLTPFTVVIPDAEQDKALAGRLRRERSGILNWLIQGCLVWQKNGLTEPNEVKVATADYRAEQDIIAGFIEDCCRLGEKQKATAAVLYAAYSKWCQEAHEEQLSKKAFGQRLAERGFTRDRTGHERWWFGVGLMTQNTPHFDTDDAS